MNPCLFCKINYQRIDFATTHCYTEPVIKLCPHCMAASRKFCATSNLYHFKWSNFVAVCTDDVDTLISSGVLKIFMEMLLIMLLQCHMCFYSKSSLCLFSLLIQQWSCHLKFVHHFTYCRFQRNWHTRKPYFKFFVTLFIWFLPFISFHNWNPLY